MTKATDSPTDVLNKVQEFKDAIVEYLELSPTFHSVAQKPASDEASSQFLSVAPRFDAVIKHIGELGEELRRAANIRMIDTAPLSEFLATFGSWDGMNYSTYFCRHVEPLLQRLQNLVEREEAIGSLHPYDESDPHAPYMPAAWFTEEFGIPAERLRGAMRDRRIKAQRVDGRWHYSVPDAKRIWPNDIAYLPNTSAETG